MNNQNATQKQVVFIDQVWKRAVDELVSLAEQRGIVAMVGAPAEAIEKIQSDVPEEFNETEQCKNLTFIREICDLKMNGCDFDYINANRHDRIAMIDQLIDSLRTMRRRMR